MILFSHSSQQNEAQQHREVLMQQRLHYMQKRQAAIDTLSFSDRREYNLAMLELKKSFLSLVRMGSLSCIEGKTQSLAVRALQNMMPDEVISLNRAEIPTHKKMFIATRTQILLDQQWAQEQDPNCDDLELGIHNFETTFNAQEIVKQELKACPNRRAYVATYQQVEEEIHHLVPPPYNVPPYNLATLRRMQNGLASIPPETLIHWGQEHTPHDMALMCDVATLGLQADFADRLAKQPAKTTAAVILAGTAATTYAATRHSKTHGVSITLAAVAGLLAFVCLMKRAHMKSFAAQARKKQRAHIEHHNLQPMANDLQQNPLPPATTMFEGIATECREIGDTARTLYRNLFFKKHTHNK